MTTEMTHSRGGDRPGSRAFRVTGCEELPVPPLVSRYIPCPTIQKLIETWWTERFYPRLFRKNPALSAFVKDLCDSLRRERELRDDPSHER